MEKTPDIPYYFSTASYGKPPKPPKLSNAYLVLLIMLLLLSSYIAFSHSGF